MVTQVRARRTQLQRIQPARRLVRARLRRFYRFHQSHRRADRLRGRRAAGQAQERRTPRPGGCSSSSIPAPHSTRSSRRRSQDPFSARSRPREISQRQLDPDIDRVGVDVGLAATGHHDLTGGKPIQTFFEIAIKGRQGIGFIQIEPFILSAGKIEQMAQPRNAVHPKGPAAGLVELVSVLR